MASVSSAASSPRWESTAGWMPDASSRRSSIAARALPSARSATLRLAVPALAQQLQVDQQRHEPRLRAVVEVAAEAAALGVAGLDDARPRGPQGLQLGAQLDLEPVVLEREPGGPRGGAQQLRVLLQRGLVDERADPVAVMGDLGRALRRERAGCPSRSM